MFVCKLPAVISFVKFFLFFQAVTAQVFDRYYLQFRWSIGVKKGGEEILNTLDFGVKMGVVLCGGILGSLIFELKTRVGVLKTSKN